MNAGPTWIVVADAGRARLFEQMRRGAALVERPEFAQSAPPARAPRDRPPRVHDRVGPARHAIAPRRTPHDAAEAQFLEHLADLIARSAQEKAFSRLIVCAPPRALGQIRKKLPPEVRDEIGVILKDIVDRPEGEIVAILQAELS